MLVKDVEYFNHEISHVDFVKSVKIRGGEFTIMRVFEEFKEQFSALHEANYSIRQPNVIEGLVSSVEAILG